ncbi:MAG: DUF2809 domain-containing protein [Kofleriaceae bacterium]|jgi:hypothetical protein|nr:DUF2809 domain-containing protein [Kofleriaceae bacterium]MBP9172124.1 DUF2809 domain-containing protein [Kofleriaceae bacterium]MBP9859559.1 DUF2809 domain-containing protein [Kofleriaceae bacterium]
MRRMLLASVALGALALLWGRWAWPAHRLVRGYGGDVAAAMLVYALAAERVERRRGRAAIAAVVAGGLEVAQAFHDGHGGLAGELVLGASFDAWDLVAYAIGIAVAVGVDTWHRRAGAAPGQVSRTSPA